MPGNFANQNLSGPLSGMVKVTVRDTSGLLRNLNAKNKAFIRTAQVVTGAYADEALRLLKALTPVDKGNMQRLAKIVSVSPQTITYDVGWEQADFFGEGLRWYVPYVLFGTSRMRARPIHLEVEAIIRPRHIAALQQALRSETQRA